MDLARTAIASPPPPYYAQVQGATPLPRLCTGLGAFHCPNYAQVQRASHCPSPLDGLLHSLLHGLRNALSLREQEQVVRTARLTVSAAHVEAAEGMKPHQSARAAAIHIEVPHVYSALRTLDV